MGHRICFLRSLLTATGSLCLVLTAAAQEPAVKPADAQNIDPAAAKQHVLDWIDQYRGVQVLFHDEDIVKLRKELADDSSEEAVRWWTKTEKIRAALESPEWQDTREWFREFLKVQAIFSDEQIEQLRVQAKDAAKQEKTRDFMDILREIESYRSQLVGGSANARALREHKMKLLNAYKQEQATQRVDAAQAATFGSINPPSSPPPRRAQRTPTAPLINSLDVARWYTMRRFWRY